MRHRHRFPACLRGGAVPPAPRPSRIAAGEAGLPQRQLAGNVFSLILPGQRLFSAEASRLVLAFARLATAPGRRSAGPVHLSRGSTGVSDNGGSDDALDQWRRSVETTPSPEDTGPETLIIGHDLPARRGRRRLNQPPPRKGNAGSGPVRPLRVSAAPPRRGGQSDWRVLSW